MQQSVISLQSLDSQPNKLFVILDGSDLRDKSLKLGLNFIELDMN